ncbi:cyclin-domain-containing protein [Basidiobolus meristosporus CBS 931.73]|uniref:Cyclin-domain-containing protein n=1 Tax=Basidiobolus meristosporus CBS 931.73 TaxID=1314790 RepID=A0A1Y1YY75_9FUNG|nr:cyclin-domain-containing protein [Basidiobolus meristosporus CBS 931.73]|eukprot:ORY02896.1 cyclin-domain-containing protein [Basidiobolus meristosporus CBS 931.73]
MASLDLGTYPVAKTVVLVTKLLESIIKANDKLPAKNVTWFHSRAVPNITVQSYLHRIFKFAPFDNEALLGVLVYFDRITELSAKRKSNFIINSLNIHRLLIASLAVSTKFSSDVFYPNSQYAKIGGLPLAELNQLELEFLFLCGFDLFVKPETLQRYGDKLLTLTRSKEKIHSNVGILHVTAKRNISSVEEEGAKEEDQKQYYRRKTYHLTIDQPYTTRITVASLLASSPILNGTSEKWSDTTQLTTQPV